MERLTERTAAGHGRIIGIKEESLAARLYKGEALKYFSVVDRLAAYEDTGLTPEQIQAQQQEINKFRTERDMEVSKTNKLYAEIRALTADKDEQAGRIMQYESALKNMYFAYQNKDPDCPHDFEIKAIEQYNALLGGAEDGK